MKNKKVYCSDCDYYKRWLGRTKIYHNCWYPKFLKDNWLMKNAFTGNPAKINRKNNCKYFEEKPPKLNWWKKLWGRK